MKTIIQIDSVEKQFANQTVIPSLNLSIYEGEFLTILGPSGCGKTTLLRMIAGFESPSSGEIILDGTSITTLPPYKRDMNLVFQHYALFPHMDVEKNITFGLRMKGVSKEEQKTRLNEVLRLTHLEEFRHRKPSQLSGGQQQRVAIARAIINKPKVLLLDEPLGALDAKLRKSLQRELKNLQRDLGITFIFVTHDQEEAMGMSDRIVVMNGGKIEQIGAPEEIYQSPESLFVSTFIGENNIIPSENSYVAIRPENLRLVKEEDAAFANCTMYAKVSDFEYLGGSTKVYLEAETDGTTLVSNTHTRTQHTFSINERVGVAWDKEDEVIFN